MKPVEYMRSEDAALHLGFTKPDGSPDLRKFMRWTVEARKKSDKNPHPLKVYRLATGRRLRFRRVDLERCVEAVEVR